MPTAGDLVRSARGLQEQRQEIVDSLTGAASGAQGAASRFADFFRHPDNLLALGVCLVAVIGIYRLLRSEQIIPSARWSSQEILGNALVRRWILGAMAMLVLAAFGLAMATGRLTSLFETLRKFF